MTKCGIIVAKMCKNILWIFFNVQFQIIFIGFLPSLASLTREPGRIEYSICLCGHLGGVSEIQKSLDVSDLFKGHEDSISQAQLLTVSVARCII